MKKRMIPHWYRYLKQSKIFPRFLVHVFIFDYLVLIFFSVTELVS